MSDQLKDLYNEWTELMAEYPTFGPRMFRALFDEWGHPTREPELVSYREDTVAGTHGIWALPENADTSKVLLFTHGGGFMVGSSHSHRKVAGHYAKALGVTAFVIDFARSPENLFPSQVNEGVAVFEGLLAAGFEAENITTIGDSAGGNLAISIPLALKAQGKPLPGHVIAMSPWLNMENNGATLQTNNDTDALITPELLAGMIGGVLGNEEDKTNPLANPLYGDFSGFPRTYITAGSVESLRDNAEQVAEKMQAAGVDVTLNVVEGQQHVFQFNAGNSQVADDTIAETAEWFKA